MHLKDCPFCNQSVEFLKHDDFIEIVHAFPMEVYCPMQFVSHQSKFQIAKIWNMRYDAEQINTIINLSQEFNEETK